MQQAKRVAKNTGILYLQMAITVLISLYTTRLVLGALGVKDFGTYNLVAGTISMLLFLNSSMTAASQRFMSYAQGEGDFKKQQSIFNISVILHFIIALFIVLLLEVVGGLLFKNVFIIDVNRLEVAKLVFHFMVGSTFLTIISVPYDAVINAHENMLFVAILRVIEVVLKMTIALVITNYIPFDKLAAYGFLMAIIYLVLFVIRIIYCHNKYQEVSIHIKKYFSKSIFKEMTNFAGWSFLGSSTSIIANYGQGIVLNMFFGTVMNAAQGISGQISGQLSAFSTTLLKALNPVFGKSEGAGKRDVMIKASLIGSKVSFFLLIFFYIPVIIEMPYIFKFWLKEIPDFAIVFCRLQLIRNLIEQPFLTIESSISAVGKIKQFKSYQSLLNILPLIITYILFNINFPAYSMYLVYISYAILMGGLTLYFAKKTFELSIILFVKDVIFRCFTSFTLIFIFTVIPIILFPESFIRLISIFIISSICFIICAWFIGFSKDEREPILRYLNSKWRLMFK